jgi:hypothetical protein
MNMPDWKHYESKYWSPTGDEQHQVTMKYQGEELRSFDESKTEKWVMLFDVFKVGETEFNPPKIFSSGAQTFAHQIRPLMEEANKKDSMLSIFMCYRKKHKEYSVIDAGIVTKSMKS